MLTIAKPTGTAMETGSRPRRVEQRNKHTLVKAKPMGTAMETGSRAREIEQRNIMR